MKKIGTIIFLFTLNIIAQNPEWIIFTPQNSPLETGFIMDIAVDDNNYKWIATDSGLIKTDGITWTSYSSKFGNSPGGRFFVVQTDKQGNIWSQSHAIGGFSIGLLKFNGTDWIVYDTSNSPLPSNNIKSILVDSNNNKWILSGNGLYNSYITKFDGNNSWSTYTGYFFNWYYGDLAALDDNNNLWMAEEYFLTKFDGINYTFYPGYFGRYPRDIIIDSTGAKWIAGGFGGWGNLARWDNGSTTYYESIEALSLTIDDKNNIWVGSYGNLYMYNGENWNSFDSSNSTIIPNTTISSLCFDKVGNLWIAMGGFQGGIAVYRPGGVIIPVELASFSADIINKIVLLEWVTVTEKNNKGFEIQQASSLTASIQGGQSHWENIGFVEGNGTTTEKQFYSFVDDNVKPGKYIYRLKQIDYDGSFEYSTEIEVEIALPKEFALYQNYPNPFNPSTVISYQLSAFGNVKLTIYDVLGNEVATLVNEEKPPGEYDVEFDGSKISSGVYFYQLRAGSFIQTNKMILMR